MNKGLKIGLISAAAVAGVSLLWWQRRNIMYSIFKANKWAYFKQLHPKFRPVFEKFDERLNKAGYDVVYTSLYRDAEKQHEVSAYSTSYHNLGMAVDINVINQKTGKAIRMASSKAEWKPVVDIAKELGLRWGGDFTGYYDAVHFDAGKLVGKKPSELLAMAKEQKVEPNKVKLT